MKLAGYIRAYKEFMFTIPIYTDGKEYFSHEVDPKYRIKEFNKIDLSDNLIKIDKNIEFEKKLHGAVIFAGEKDDLIVESLENGIKIIKDYLQQKTQKDQFINVKEDVSYFESLITQTKKTVYFRAVKSKENKIYFNDIQFILSFLNQNENPRGVPYELINSMYEKVANSENKEKAIVEFKNEIIKVKSPVYLEMVNVNRSLIFNKKIKLNKLVRKKAVSNRQNLRKVRLLGVKQQLGAKIIFIKDIIEKIEGKQKKDSKAAVNLNPNTYRRKSRM